MSEMDREKIEAALDDFRLAVKVGRGWWTARRDSSTFSFDDGTWIIRIRAKQRARGIITNIDGNAQGREFAFV